MNYGYQCRVRMRLQQPLWVNGATPFFFHPYYLCAGASSNVAHSCAENAVDSDHDTITRFYEVDKSCFHPSGTGRANWKGQGVAGLPHSPQIVIGFVEQSYELRVQMTEHWLAQSFHHFGVWVTWPRAH